MLTFASVIHKVQNLSLPRATICFDDLPSHGELNVPMSRVRRAGELCFFGVNAGDVKERFQMYDTLDVVMKKPPLFL